MSEKYKLYAVWEMNYLGQWNLSVYHREPPNYKSVNGAPVSHTEPREVPDDMSDDNNNPDFNKIREFYPQPSS